MLRSSLLLLFICCCLLCEAQNTGYIKLDTARFITGTRNEWKDPNYKDNDWKTIKTGEVWQNQGYPDYHGYAWYRIHVVIPSSLKQKSAWGDSLHINLAHVNDVDETYLNGVKIGKTGAYPDDKGGYVSKWPAVRNYCLAVNNPAIKWDQENVIAIKVYDGGGTGGIFMGSPFIDMLEKTDGIEFNITAAKFLKNGTTAQKFVIRNNFNTTTPGTFHYKLTDASNGALIRDSSYYFQLAPFSEKEVMLNFPGREGIEMEYEYTEKESGKTKTFHEVAPYLLTPAPPDKPVINGPSVYGAKPGHDILYKIPVSGVRPLKFSVEKLPAGLKLDPNTGIISGVVEKKGIYTMTLVAANKLGADRKIFNLKVGETLALTPPMGWNSWNCWGISVSADKVKSSALAMINKGLTNFGWSYINVDDGWQSPDRLAGGEIVPNGKFPDMTALSNYLHAVGLKFGVYSSPGTKTCGGFTGSLGHEAQDALTYKKWGVDYLKYDLCSYTDIIKDDTSLAVEQAPYIKMRDELKKQKRDIIYSLCQYGIHDVWKWGKQMDGNSWRTTEDITDTWESMYNIGFRQDKLYPYAGPGGWNDPDMLIVGMVGWGENLHPTRLTPYEQYTHISLWSMLSAPLLIGCDMGKLDDFTLNLLKNKEVIAVDQDPLGKQAQKVIDKNNFQVWVKPMSDGSKVIGIFNINDHFEKFNFTLKMIGINNPGTLRDIWRQKNIGTKLSAASFNIPPHGVRLIKISGS